MFKFELTLDFSGRVELDIRVSNVHQSTLTTTDHSYYSDVMCLEGELVLRILGCGARSYQW